MHLDHVPRVVHADWTASKSWKRLSMALPTTKLAVAYELMLPRDRGTCERPHRGRWTGKWRTHTNTTLSLTYTPFFGSPPLIMSFRLSATHVGPHEPPLAVSAARRNVANAHLRGSILAHTTTQAQPCAKRQRSTRRAHGEATHLLHASHTCDPSQPTRLGTAGKERARDTSPSLSFFGAAPLLEKKKRPGMGATFVLCHRRQ